MKIVKYGADWCTPCKEIEKYLNILGIEFETIDIEKSKMSFAKKGLNSIPFLEIYNDSGKMLGRVIGCPDTATELKHKIDKILAKDEQNTQILR